MTDAPKKLIEVALPLAEINDASAYDKMPGIGAHPKGIHHWWARLPLPVARAVIFASVVDDPSGHPDRFPTAEAQEQERERLFGILRRMMQPRLHEHPEVYAEARKEMLRHCGGTLPPVLDPFAGGGSIPLEAARLGMEAYAGDLNPVAVLLNRCYLELVPRWDGCPPVNPVDRAKIGGKQGWRGAAGLAADVRYYGRVILERARERIGHLYPPARVTVEMAAEHPHLQGYIGKDLPVIAWLWARTVPSPDPAARGAAVPLMSTFWLSSKKGSEAYLEPVVDRATRTWRFRVRTGAPPDRDAVKAGTKIGRALFRCLITGAPIPDDYIKEQGKAGRMGARLVAIVADAGRGRVYLPATEEHEAIARKAEPAWRPEEPLAYDPIAIKTPLWGLGTLADHFTPRQLTAMATLSDLVREARADVRRDAAAAVLSDAEADAYAATVTTFLALALDRCADHTSSLCTWNPHDQVLMHSFGRQAIPMTWDFAEGNTLAEGRASWWVCTDRTADCLETVGACQGGHARPIDAASPWDGLANVLVSTDPPYYDNIGYAALSDFFYVWLRRTIGDLYPDLFGTILVPKEPELVAAPERFGGDKRKAKEHFEEGFRKAFARLRDKMDPRFPLTVYYAFKQDDEETAGAESGDGDGGRVDRTTGWETLLTALVETGFQVTATWPVRSAQKWRQNAMGSNALASYIVLACRPRPADAPEVSRAVYEAELGQALREALPVLAAGGVAPVDLAQASIGPGMAVYSRYAGVLRQDGRRVTVREALRDINKAIADYRNERTGTFDDLTRFCIEFYEQFGFGQAPYGEADTLARAKNVGMNTLEAAHLLETGGGTARLVPLSAYPVGVAGLERPFGGSAWEACLRLAVTLHQEGEDETAALARELGEAISERARELAVWLFTLAESKKRTQDAVAFNALDVAWPEIRAKAAAAGRQGRFA